VTDLATMPSIRDACGLIEDWLDHLLLAPRVREDLGCTFGAVLDRVADGDEAAIAAWRRVEREMKTPRRAHERWIDRLVTVDAMARQFQATLQ
jgi:hypothetical protein